MKNFLYKISVFSGKLAVYFAHEEKLYKARHARLHELVKHIIDKADITEKMSVILLGIGQFDKVLCVKPTKDQKELANVLLLGKTRIGKGLNIGTNLLQWPFPAIINDIKEEHWNLTAGFREKGLDGKAFKFDPRGNGHKFDPLENIKTEFDLRSAATILLHRAHEGQNAVFTERGITMLTQVLIAATLEGERKLPFTYKILNEGLYGVATILEIISEKHNYYPNLATKFLDTSYDKADFKSKFLQDCFSTMTGRINNILTKETVRCFTGSDFTAKDIITSGKHPISVFLCWPEKDLVFLSPLIELVWDSLINGMVDTYDTVRGKGCYRTLLMLDEIFRTGMFKLHDYATTVCGRNMSLFVSAQSDAQLDAEYGEHKANKLRGQFDTVIVHPPAPLDYKTQDNIERCLGYQSGFAHSKNEYERGTSTGESEQRIPLMPASESEYIGATKVIVKRFGTRATIAERLDWRRFPELVQRANMVLPQLPKIANDMNVVPNLSFSMQKYQRNPRNIIPLYQRLPASPAG